MDRCKYGAGNTASHSKKLFWWRRRAAIEPQTEDAPITLHDLPRDILHKILIEHKALKEADIKTYSEQLRLATTIEPGVVLTKEAMEPEKIELFRDDTLIQTFTSIDAFKEYVGTNKENLVDTSLIMTGKLVRLIITNDSTQSTNFIILNIVHPDSTIRAPLASFIICYMIVRGNPTHISISKVSLTIYVIDQKLSELHYINDLIVGVSWLSYVFTTIERVHTLEFDERSINIPEFPSRYKQTKLLLREKLLKLYKYIEQTLQLKTRRVGGKLRQKIQ